MMSRVLVVDDDRPLTRSLGINLRAHGFDVTLAYDGRTALTEVTRVRPAVVVLDLGLPDLDGIEVLGGIRGWSAVPVIVLSARSTSAEKVEALDAGADDYVTKPFGMEELLARIRASVRRGGTQEPSAAANTVVTDDFAAHQVHQGRATVRLTPTEWSLLEILVRHHGDLVPHRQLLIEIWGPGTEQQTHYLRVYLAQLRRKLEPDTAHPRYLITEAGVGYRFQL